MDKFDTNLSSFGLGVCLPIGQQVLRTFKKELEELEGAYHFIKLRNVMLVPKFNSIYKTNTIIIQGLASYRFTSEQMAQFEKDAAALHFTFLISDVSTEPMGLVEMTRKDNDEHIVDKHVYGFSIALQLPEYLQDEVDAIHLLDSHNSEEFPLRELFDIVNTLKDING